MDKYIILQTSSAFDLAWQVNQKIKDGYTPLGGPCLSQTFESIYLTKQTFVQALVLLPTTQK